MHNHLTRSFAGRSIVAAINSTSIQTSGTGHANFRRSGFAHPEIGKRDEGQVRVLVRGTGARTRDEYWGRGTRTWVYIPEWFKRGFAYLRNGRTRTRDVGLYTGEIVTWVSIPEKWKDEDAGRGHVYRRNSNECSYT